MLLSVIILIGVLIDQTTKYCMSLQEGVVIPGVLEIAFVHNEGVSLGLPSFIPSAWLAAAALLALGVLAIVFREMIHGTLQTVCLGLIFAGGLGNLIDRIRLGYVTDFLNLLFVRFYVFNAADIMVTAGAVMWGISLIAELRHGRRKI